MILIKQAREKNGVCAFDAQKTLAREKEDRKSQKNTKAEREEKTERESEPN